MARLDTCSEPPWVRTVFDLHDGDCYASVGGHRLDHGSVPTYPDEGGYWCMVERHKITQFYTAPTAIRTLMRSATRR